jgi:hypothetical protein
LVLVLVLVIGCWGRLGDQNKSDLRMEE